MPAAVIPAAAPDSADVSSPTDKGSTVRRYLAPSGLVLALGWVVVITLLIARNPGPGADSPERLTAALQSAVANNDKAAAGHLMADEPNADAVAAAVVAPPHCGGAPLVRLVPDGDAYRLELSRADGTPCGALRVTRQNGRWVIDPWFSAG